MAFLIRKTMAGIIEQHIDIPIVGFGNVFQIANCRQHHAEGSILVFTYVGNRYTQCLLTILAEYLHVVFGKRDAWYKLIVLVTNRNDEGVVCLCS